VYKVKRKADGGIERFKARQEGVKWDIMCKIHSYMDFYKRMFIWLNPKDSFILNCLTMFASCTDLCTVFVKHHEYGSLDWLIICKLLALSVVRQITLYMFTTKAQHLFTFSFMLMT
jgi:hypothetical protein